MGYQLGVDVGTTFTAAAINLDGQVRVLPLSAESPLVPSLVGIHPDGPIVVGAAAAALADYDQRLVASAFKRRMGDPTPIVVAGTPYDASWYMSRVLAWVIDNAAHQMGERPESVAVTHPANWHSHKITRMRQAVAGADLDPSTTTLLTEPEAAAVAYANDHDVAVGETLVVYDLGGGTFDTAVLRRQATGFTILGRPQGMERLGGLDFDAAVYRYLTDRLGSAFNALDPNDPVISRQLTRLRQECIAAKETLSFRTESDIDVAVGPIRQRIELTRANFESLIQPVLMESIGAVRRLLRSADLDSDQISRILLAGGSSHIPLVAEIISQEMGREVSVDDDPKQVVALGAAYKAGVDRLAKNDAITNETNGHNSQIEPETNPVAQSPVAPTPVVPTPAAPNPVADVPPRRREIPVSPLELSLENETSNSSNGSATPPSQPIPAAPPLRPADPAPSRPTRAVPATRRPPTTIDDSEPELAPDQAGIPAPQHRSEPISDDTPPDHQPQTPAPPTAAPSTPAAPTPAPPAPPTAPTAPTAPSSSPDDEGAPPSTEIAAAGDRSAQADTPTEAAPSVAVAAATAFAPAVNKSEQRSKGPTRRPTATPAHPTTAAAPGPHEPTAGHMLGTTTAAFEAKPTRRRRALYIGVAGLLLVLAVGLAVVLRGIFNNDQPQEAGGVPTSLAEAGSWPSTVTMSIKTAPGVNIEQLVVVQILEDELGIDIDVRPSTDYSGVADDLATGAAALGILDAFSYSVATQAGSEIEPAAVQTQDSDDPGYTHSYGLTAIENDSVQSLGDFTPGVVCFADRDSLSGFRIPASELETVGVDLASASSAVTAQIAGSHESAVRFITDGTCPVGFVASEAVDDLLLNGKLPGLADATGEVDETRPNEATVRVAWLSPKIMNGPLAMSSSLPQSLRNAIAETLTGKANRDWAAANGYCSDSGTTCTINSDGGWGYAPTSDPDFDGIRRLCRPAPQDGCRP